MAGSSGPVRALGFGGGEFHETRSHEVQPVAAWGRWSRYASTTGFLSVPTCYWYSNSAFTSLLAVTQ